MGLFRGRSSGKSGFEDAMLPCFEKLWDDGKLRDDYFNRESNSSQGFQGIFPVEHHSQLAISLRGYAMGLLLTAAFGKCCVPFVHGLSFQQSHLLPLLMWSACGLSDETFLRNLDLNIEQSLSSHCMSQSTKILPKECAVPSNATAHSRARCTLSTPRLYTNVVFK